MEGPFPKGAALLIPPERLDRPVGGFRPRLGAGGRPELVGKPSRDCRPQCDPDLVATSPQFRSRRPSPAQTFV